MHSELGAIKSMMKEMLEHSQSMQAKLNAMEAINESLEKSLQEMLHRQKYHEALLKDQNWEYSADPPPSPYWVSIRHSQHYIHAARSFLNEIKSTTCGMRRGSEDCDKGRVYVGSSSYLAHDDVFTPHWIEFANAFKGFRHLLKCLPEQNTSLLQLRNVNLPRDVLDLLEKALEDVHFTGLVLQANDLGYDGLCFALRYAQKNTILKELHLERNSIESTNDLQLLCDVIRAHHSLESLKIVNCNGGAGNPVISGSEILSSIVTAGIDNLKHIDLSGNSIKLSGRFLHNILSRNPVLQKLELGRNKLDGDDAMWIAEALKSNTNLNYLGLWRNPIKEKGCSALSKAEFDNSSLNTAADSNHTCLIEYPDNCRGINDASAASGLRSKKIYSVLSTRNKNCSNAELLDKVPVEILPNLLVSIQSYSKYPLSAEEDEDDDRVLALSVVYEVMRWWDKILSAYK